MAGSVDSADGDPGFQIAPMVDVVFVLMLFFMASAGTKIIERELSTSLPSSAPLEPGRVPDLAIMVEISADGQVVANNIPFGTPADKKLAAMRDWLKATQRWGGQDPVTIRPNANTRHERVVDVLNACAAAGIRNLAFN